MLGVQVISPLTPSFRPSFLGACGSPVLFSFVLEAVSLDTCSLIHLLGSGLGSDVPLPLVSACLQEPQCPAPPPDRRTWHTLLLSLAGAPGGLDFLVVKSLLQFKRSIPPCSVGLSNHNAAQQKRIQNNTECNL